MRHGLSSAQWKKILAESITSPSQLGTKFKIQSNDLEKVVSTYPMRINPYYLGLIQHQGDPIYRQCVPDIQEIESQAGWEDPLNEEALSPIPGLTHKYPDRVLFLISNYCPVYCRFCNRKRKVGREALVDKNSIREGIRYIRKTPSVRDVLLSGGDPLVLETPRLREILKELRAISHVEIIRIGTRAPCTLPQRITPDLVEMLRQFHPIYINTHFNHPREITPEAIRACGRLVDAGIPLGNQTVLLRGVNDDLGIMKDLVQRLVQIRVRPYYLFQADLVKGTSHFWTPLQTGLDIMEGLQGHTSGICLPHFAVDLPGGGGKVPLLPDYILKRDVHHITIRNYCGQIFSYPKEPSKAACSFPQAPSVNSSLTRLSAPPAKRNLR